MEKTMYITLILSYEKQSYVKRLHEEFSNDLTAAIVVFLVALPQG